MSHSDQLKEILACYSDTMQDNHCVYRLFYSVKGKKDACITVMTKLFHTSLTNIEYNLSYYFKNQFKDRDGFNAYQDFYKYVYENQVGNFHIDFCYAGDRPYEALKVAYIYLNPDDKYVLLNANSEPLIPKGVQRKAKRVWINRGHYLNFKTWQKKYDANRKKPV